MTQGKKGSHKKWQDYLFLVGLMIVLLVFAKATWGLYRKNKLARENLSFSTERMKKLSDREAVLRDKIERLKTARGVEEEIRNNFPVVKEGEHVINIVEKKDQLNTATATPAKWWQIW